MDEECTVMVPGPKYYADCQAVLKSVEDKLELKVGLGHGSIDYGVVVYNVDGSIASVAKYRQLRPSEEIVNHVFAQSLMLLNHKLANDSEYKEIVDLEISAEERLAKLKALNRADGKLQALEQLLDGPTECLGFLEIDDIEKIESLPEEYGQLMVHSYAICKKVLEQVPVHCQGILRKLATVTSFVPRVYLDKTHDYHGLEE